MGQGLPESNSRATSPGTWPQELVEIKMSRFQLDGCMQRWPRTRTWPNHSFLSMIAWRMKVAEEKPHLESYCIERNKSRKSVSILKFCWIDFSEIKRNTVKNEGISHGAAKIGYNQISNAIRNREPRCQSWAHRKARPFAKSRRAKVVQRRSIFVKCACALQRKFAEHEKN